MYQGEAIAAYNGGAALSIRPRQTPRAGRAQGFRGVSGMAFGPDIWDPPTSGGGGGSGGGGDNGGGFDWSDIFGVIRTTLPATISAIKGQGVPQGYYPTNAPGYTQPQYAQVPPGYQYVNGELVPTGSNPNAPKGIDDIANSLTNFVTKNPLLILGGVVGLALLFKSPPSRR